MSPFDQELYENHFRVAIFGSARIEQNDPSYNQVFNLARMIGEAGHDTVTGGGPGIMEAASRGHQAGAKNAGNGAHSIGLNIKLPQEQIANRHLDVKREFSRFSARLDYFMRLSNVVVVAPGGVGTLLEFFYTWQLVQVEQICNIPIILLGKMWGDLAKWLEAWPLKDKFISRSEMTPLFLAQNCKGAMRVIKKAHEEYKKGGDDFCLNFQKYKMD